MNEQIQQILISALEVIITGIIGYLGILIGNYFRKKNNFEKREVCGHGNGKQLRQLHPARPQRTLLCGNVRCPPVI